MTEDPRIQQFKQMAEADPDNELGHFSLGKIYLESGRFDDAIPPLSRATEPNPKLSKAYQLLGEAYEKAGAREKAVDVVTRGVTVADEQGDRVPRDAMAAMLTGWGAPVPGFKVEARAAPEAQAGGATTPGFRCSRCGCPGGQLEKTPFKGPLGQTVLESVCSNCWREWVLTGTKVINELGLALSTAAGQEAYDQYMVEFLQLEDR